MAVESNQGPLLGQRHLQSFLLFLCYLIKGYGMLSTSVLVVAMTDSKNTNPDFPEYDWTEMEKSLIISSLFWCYSLTQVPGGWLCRRFGAKATMLVAIATPSVLAALIPTSVKYGGWVAYCAIRFAQGIFYGFIYPCSYANLAAWCPVNERNRLGALVTMGGDWGSVFSMFVTGMLAISPLGWPGVSYFTAVLGGVWCILWLLFAANSPSDSKWISLEEKAYIEDSQNALKEDRVTKNTKNIAIPWRQIFTSAPFLALIVVRSSEIWGYFTIQAELPAYLNGVLGMAIKENAVFSALPFFCMMGSSYIYVILADILIKYDLLSLNALRKTFNTLALWLPAVGLIALGFIEKEAVLAIVLITASMAINAGNVIGSGLNTIDLSPNHAGILMGIVNTFAFMMPMIVPVFVGAVVKDQADRTEWQIVFTTAAIVFFIGNLVFLIFGSTNLQPWNEEPISPLKDIEKADSCKLEKEIVSKLVN